MSERRDRSYLRSSRSTLEMGFDRGLFPNEDERMAYLHRAIEARVELAEKEAKFPFMDETGESRGEILFDPPTGDIVEVRTNPWSNKEGVAEKNDEHIYITDDEGNITETRATRKEARDQGLRYLVASTLIFNNGKVLVQRRSPDKKLDPDKLSASAHGVASEIMRPDGKRFKNTDNIGAITSVLETNEELRHGEGETPFTVRFWPHGKERDLFKYARHFKLNDPDTIWVVPQAMYTQDAYPLGSGKNKRTRFISTGFIFSEHEPHISPDPAEVTSSKWIKMSEYGEDPMVTEDMQNLTDMVAREWQEQIGENAEEIMKNYVTTNPMTASLFRKKDNQE